MSINVKVSERVLMVGRAVYAESRRYVFRKHSMMSDGASILRLANTVRSSGVIPLAGWECFSKQAGGLPEVYLEAVTLE